MRLAVTVLLSLMLASCTTFREDHYFQSLNAKNGRATNYFRVRVEGHAGLSRARYLAGYYDERAVDLFFNEMKPSGNELSAPLFPAGLKEPGGETVIRPLSPDDKHGTLVMILSTNAKAVADAIGQIAENQVAANALTNLVNRGDLIEAKRTEARLASRAQSAAAVAAELQALINGVPPDDPDGQATTDAYLRVLNAIARALGSTQVFASLDEAVPFFNAQAAVRP